MSETTDSPRRAYLTKARRTPLTGRRPRRRDLRVNRQLQPVTGVASSSPNPRTRAIGPWDSPGGPGVRVDTTVFAGYEIPPFYDSMVGKLIVYGRYRHEALMRGRRALEEYRLEGIKTTVPLHLRLIEMEPSSLVSTTPATSRGS